MKWTEEVFLFLTQESELLKELRNKYCKNSWEKIAKELNSSNINKTKKTGRQCRERYINCFKFNEKNTGTQGWSKEENERLYEIYSLFGSSWTNLESFFPNK